MGPYSQAIRAGQTVWLSGQLGLDPATGNLAEGVEAQTHQVFRNLRAVAQAAGGELADIVKLTLLLTDLDDFARVNAIMTEYFTAPFPARATYQVAALPKAARIEIEDVLHLSPVADAVSPQTGSREAFDQTKGSDRPGCAVGPAREGGEGDRNPRRPPPASPTSSFAWASRATRTSSSICRCATRTTRASCRCRAQPASSSRSRAPSSTPTSSTGRGGSSSRSSRTAADARRPRQLVLRFFPFYPNQQKALAPGKRVRVFGEVRHGHLGLEIVHPQFKVIEHGAPLPDRLTPVYPTTAGLGQETLRKVVARALPPIPRTPPKRCPISRGGTCGNSATRCASCTRRRRELSPRPRSARSTSARIRRGRGSSSTSWSRSSCR